MSRPSGMTLIEMTVSLAIVAVLGAAMGSTMILAGKAMPGNPGPADRTLKAAAILEEVAWDLQYALTIVGRSPHAIEFTVPDRDGNGSAEVIRYEWSSVAGDPLLWQYNGQSPAVLLEDVHLFDVSGLLRAAVDSGSASPTEGDEELLISHDDSGGSVAHRVVEALKWPGQYFRPELPPEATGWRVTRVKIKAKRAGIADGVVLVQLRGADGSSKPTSEIYGQAVMMEADLTGDYLWREFAFPSAPVLEPTSGAAVVLVHALGAQACWTRYETNGADTPDAHYVSSTNAGISWTTYTSMDMLFYVYGRVSSPDAAATGSARYYLTGVRLGLKVGPDGTEARTLVRTLNEPEVTAP